MREPAFSGIGSGVGSFYLYSTQAQNLSSNSPKIISTDLLRIWESSVSSIVIAPSPQNRRSLILQQ
ncbi:hypothetical protein [Nostoc sp. 106C]|uniref:hypothetical protein n=1 Tax=Nostoc sp. 106C TaxID=1932667 RepID=UPI0030DD3BB7